MKRLHVNLTTADLPRSISFYTELFGAEPTVNKTDYAKWMLDDPRVNFSLSTHGGEPGVDHLGIEAEEPREFEALRTRLLDSENEVFEQPEVTCCYANSSKAWIRDPNGVAWETFISHAESIVYGDGSRTRADGSGVDAPARACCDSAVEAPGSCCL